MSKRAQSPGTTYVVKHIRLKDGTELIYEGKNEGYWEMLTILKKMGEI